MAPRKMQILPGPRSANFKRFKGALKEQIHEVEHQSPTTPVSQTSDRFMGALIERNHEPQSPTPRSAKSERFMGALKEQIHEVESGGLTSGSQKFDRFIGALTELNREAQSPTPRSAKSEKLKAALTERIREAEPQSPTPGSQRSDRFMGAMTERAGEPQSPTPRSAKSEMLKAALTDRIRGVSQTPPKLRFHQDEEAKQFRDAPTEEVSQLSPILEDYHQDGEVDWEGMQTTPDGMLGLINNVDMGLEVRDTENTAADMMDIMDEMNEVAKEKSEREALEWLNENALETRRTIKQPNFSSKPAGRGTAEIYALTHNANPSARQEQVPPSTRRLGSQHPGLISQNNLQSRQHTEPRPPRDYSAGRSFPFKDDFLAQHLLSSDDQWLAKYELYTGQERDWTHILYDRGYSVPGYFADQSQEESVVTPEPTGSEVAPQTQQKTLEQLVEICHHGDQDVIMGDTNNTQSQYKSAPASNKTPRSSRDQKSNSDYDALYQQNLAELSEGPDCSCNRSPYQHQLVPTGPQTRGPRTLDQIYAQRNALDSGERRESREYREALEKFRR